MGSANNQNLEVPNENPYVSVANLQFGTHFGTKICASEPPVLENLFNTALSQEEIEDHVKDLSRASNDVNGNDINVEAEVVIGQKSSIEVLSSDITKQTSEIVADRVLVSDDNIESQCDRGDNLTV